MQKARAVDALDARHFDVRGGAGSGNPGDERGRLRAECEVLRKSFYNLTCAQYAQMPVGQQREHSPSFAGRVVQYDGARVGDATESFSHHAFRLLDFIGRESVVRDPLDAVEIRSNGNQVVR